MAAQAEHSNTTVLLMMETMKQQLPSITIPPLQCSFPWSRHPLTPKLELSCDAWILARFSNLPSCTNPDRLLFTTDQLLNSGFPLLGVLTYANSLPSRIEPAVKFLAWFFLIDSVVDDPAEMGADSVASDALINCIIDVLEQPTYSYSGNNLICKAMVESAQDWWYALREGMSPRQRARFITIYKEYLEGNRPQIVFRANGALPELDIYKRIRGDAGGWFPCSVVIEYVHGVELDDEALNHRLVVALRTVAAYNVYWVNDVCSFTKELLENDYVNIVPILYNHHVKQQKKNVSLESVVGEVCAMIKECDEECMRLMAEIKASKLLMSKVGMAEYLQGVGDWLAGNRYWHLVSGRYGLGGSEDMYHCAPQTSVQHKVRIQGLLAGDAPQALVPMHSA